MTDLLTPDPTLLDRARDWLVEDPDEATRARLATLIQGTEAGDLSMRALLADSFAGSLQFGTAGLRGALGPGSNRMNRVVVMRAAAGLAAFLRRQHPAGGAVVIGYDARYNSDVFARDTAAVMTGAGLSALVLPRPLPTPVLAYAIRQLGCIAGVMVTASHNPPQDNGYKVYLGDGTQIVPPVDTEIADCIDAVGRVSELPLGTEWNTLDDTLLDNYLTRVVSLLPPGPRDVSVVYTAMHGVGGTVFRDALQRSGFPTPVLVTEQFDPDPEFPTVAFPNPEEPGAIDLALAAATSAAADVVIANDPDADRCAVALPNPYDSSWSMLRGDEVGALLAWWILERARRAGHPVSGTMACSIVSSSLLGRIAADAGLPYEETLTGFKWIGRIPDLLFGYEEALGYCVDAVAVSDKDGVSAGLLVAELVAALKGEDRTVDDVLGDLARRFGLHATDQVSVRVDDIAVITDAMSRLRADPPTSLAGRDVVSFEDLEQGSDSLPPTDGVRLRLAGDARVIIRPSGTEPKLKCYLEVVVPVDPALGAVELTGLSPLSGPADVAVARRSAATALTELGAAVSAVLNLPGS